MYAINVTGLIMCIYVNSYEYNNNKKKEKNKTQPRLQQQNTFIKGYFELKNIYHCS